MKVPPHLVRKTSAVIRRAGLAPHVKTLLARNATVEAKVRQLVQRSGAGGAMARERTPNEVTNALALELLARGQHKEADVVLTTFLDRSPTASRTRFLRGVTRLAMGHVDAARKDIDRAFGEAWYMRDELHSLPKYPRLVAEAARQRPDWAWPRYFILKSTQLLPRVDADALLRVVDRREPPTGVMIVTGDGSRTKGVPLDLTVPRMRTIVMTDAPAVGARQRLRYLARRNTSHVTIGRWPQDGASPDAGELLSAVERAGGHRLDLLGLDAGRRAADIVRAVLESGQRPGVVWTSLYRVPLATRCELAELLQVADYRFHFGYDSCVAVGAEHVRDRRIHAWAVGDADFDLDLVDDLVSEPPVDLAAAVQRTLEENQIRFFITPTHAARRTRFSIGRPDLEVAISRLLELDLAPFRLHVENLRNADKTNGVISLYPVDDRRRYKGNVVELDPWVRNDTYVRSSSANRFVNWIPVKDIERTMFAYNPPYLVGDREKPVRMEERLGLRSTVLDHFDFEVDIVFTWVDGSDAAWLAKKAAYHAQHEGRAVATSVDFSESRFRSRDELRYALRSVAAYFPMARRIFLVTDNQVPEWLDVDHPAIEVVDHTQIFADPSWLPTFNSNAIESQLCNIPGLSEHWLYFNDDVMLLGPCTEGSFFLPSGLGRSFLEPQRSQYGAPAGIFHNSKNAVLRSSQLFQEAFGKSFHQFHMHTPFAMRTSTFDEMRKVFGDALDETAQRRFRGADDVAPISSLYQWYALHTGQNVPSSIGYRYINLGAPNVIEALERLELRSEHAVLCINDAPNPTVDEALIDRVVRETLERLYPVPASWER